MIVKINKIYYKGYLGFYSYEKKKKRVIYFNVAYKIADEEKNINQILNYEKLTKKIRNFLDENSFELIENLTYKLTNYLSLEKNIHWIEVECIKPIAFSGAEKVSVYYKKECIKNE